eukprot:4381573-Pyramimonas_sp.AAC.1
MAGAVEARWWRGNLRLGSGGMGESQEYESICEGLALRGRGGRGVNYVRSHFGSGLAQAIW